MCANQHAGITGMTFGAFDLCHQGHINLLRQAKERCDTLIVCISSDNYIISNKKHPPLLCWNDRKYLVGLTGYADIIDTQWLNGKKPLIEKYSPNILFVGSDWNEDTYSGEGLCDVEYLDYTPYISTSWYRERLNINP